VATDDQDSLELDLLAASLRADLSDIGAFVEGLAAKLEDALPGLVEVERVRQGFRGPKFVRRIALNTGGSDRLELRRDGDRVQTLRAHVSGGIVLKSEAVDIDTWITSLSAIVAAEAGHNERTRQALERLLMS
jgi:hypothetical protein